LMRIRSNWCSRFSIPDSTFLRGLRSAKWTVLHHFLHVSFVIWRRRSRWCSQWPHWCDWYFMMFGQGHFSSVGTFGPDQGFVKCSWLWILLFGRSFVDISLVCSDVVLGFLAFQLTWFRPISSTCDDLQFKSVSQRLLSIIRSTFRFS
jgi:hypothetical protein